jgi:hypothetical protein
MYSTIKNIPLFFGIVILAMVIPFSLSVANQKTSVNPTIQAANKNPLINIFPEKISTIRAGQTGTFSIYLNTEDKLFTGIDITLKYNPREIKIDKNLSSVGSIFKYYPGNIMVDEQKGTIAVSGRGEFQGIGVLAKIGFIPLTTNENYIENERINSGIYTSNFTGSTIKAIN